ncbi:MAG: glycoside hydrolase family 78 protein [Clostridiales bacterium]|nr:glycoside hydrolase family 78 protein [Clostridiales bacterium]MDD7310278.1 family 78 glycoside hydrolase catalytic domain [Eubacteriales bacterium]MDY5347267.1 family 78 glycoside hydrolase catalytic domain [Eubacteriales bacterium]
MKIERLKINHLTTPLGFRLDEPQLSWVVTESTGTKPVWARVEAAADASFANLLYDSGKRDDLNPLACPLPLTFAPRTRYFWRVTVCADDGDCGSASSWFETGKMDEPFAGQWIAAPFEKTVHPILRRTFTLDGAAEDARLYITGLGLYEAYLNGQPVTDEVLTPFYNDYNFWVQVQTYDVTGLLRAGENVLDVYLGNGWYKGFGPNESDGSRTELYGDRMQMLAELRAVLPDGKSFCLASDESFRCHTGPVLESTIYDGEIYDARLADPGEDGWAAAVSVDAPVGAAADRLSTPLRRHEAIKPVKLLHTPAGEQVLDFGQVITGWVEADVLLPAGAEMALDYGELLQHDNFYNENLRSAKAHFSFTSDGKPAHVRPHFTFYGFRFVRVTGIEAVNPDDFTAYVIHSDLERTGFLETSNAKVNRLIQNAWWGQRGNFVDVPTDCPQRDERLGWTGDAEVFAPTASFNMDTAAFYRKYLYDMALEQATLGGAVPFVVPDVLGQIHRHFGEENHDYGSCAWADAAVMIPWTLYRFYGDKSMLAEQFPQMMAWVDWVETQDETHFGGPRLWLRGFHFADWLALDNPVAGSCFGGTDCYYVASAYYYYSTYLTARAAEALGDQANAKKYDQRAEEIRAAFRKEFFTATGRIAEPTQTAMLLALSMNLAPDEARPRLVRDLRKKLEARNMHLDTGFVGTYHLMRTLSSVGLGACAYTLLLNEDYPSWLYEVNMGATTVWERWNSVLPDGLVSDTGMNSMNHYSYGAVVEWMYRCMCGLNAIEPGFASARIAPMSDDRFDWVRAEYASASGTYRSGWQRENGVLTYTVEVPFGATAVFVPESADARLEINGKPAAKSGEVTLTPGVWTIRALA